MPDGARNEKAAAGRRLRAAERKLSEAKAQIEELRSRLAAAERHNQSTCVHVRHAEDMRRAAVMFQARLAELRSVESSQTPPLA